MAGNGGDNDASGLSQPLIWIDLEMTGLDPSRHVIVEAAVIITDGSLETRIAGPELVIAATDDELAEMEPIVAEMHTKSGLLQRIGESTVTVAAAEAEILHFVKEHVPKPKGAPLAGNSVHADRAFLEVFMPGLAEHLHYRSVDVSSVKELAKRWYPDIEPFEKAGIHRALADIQESIEELAYYRSAVFRAPDQSPQ